MTPLLVIPEHKVPLPGRRTESQNDAFVLASTLSGVDLHVGWVVGNPEYLRR